MSSVGRQRKVVGILALALLVLGGACADPAEQSVRRGDRLLGAGDVDEAIAEYRLAIRQGGETPDKLVRLGNAYAIRGDADEALRHYELLLSTDSTYRYQMAGDLIDLGRSAMARGNRESMARAVRPLLDMGIGLVPVDLRLAVARHYWEDGDYVRALPLYLSVLSEAGVDDPENGPPPSVFYEAGRAYEELGGCLESLEYFRRYLDAAGPRAGEVPSARWHYGSCLFEVAEANHAAGRPGAALENLDRMIRLGVPQTLLDRAHFLRGELLMALGEDARALAAYEEVLRMNPARSGPLVQRAEARIRQIRFGYD